jgi:hypothetical protein
MTHRHKVIFSLGGWSDEEGLHRFEYHIDEGVEV